MLGGVKWQLPRDVIEKADVLAPLAEEVKALQELCRSSVAVNSVADLSQRQTFDSEAG